MPLGRDAFKSIAITVLPLGSFENLAFLFYFIFVLAQPPKLSLGRLFN